MREWFVRFIDWCRRDRLERELREELEFHQQQVSAEAEFEGLSPQDVGRAARRRIGSTTRIVEDARDQWAIRWADHLHQDLKYAIRACRRAPAFTTVVVVVLSLGIGVNAAMFDVVDRLMFRPLPHLKDPGTVHRIYQQTTVRGGPFISPWMSFARYEHLRTGTSSFSTFAGFNERLMLVGTGETARERRIGAVTASYFDLFDAQPALGRFFSAAEDVPPAGSPVVVLSHSLWQTEFGEANVLGQRLQVGSSSATIIGVAPPRFTGVDDAQPPILFVPLSHLGPIMGGANAQRFSVGYNALWASVLVRRKAEVSEQAASTDLTQAFRRSWEAQRTTEPSGPLAPIDEADPRAIVSAVRLGAGPNPSLEARTAVWVAGVAVLVLLVAWANVTNLFAGRALVRQHETAVRLALGISRGRLLVQSLVESFVLAVLAAGAALGLAYVSRAAIFGLLAPATGIAAEAFVDRRTLLVTAAITFVTALVTGVAPAVFARRAALADGMKRGGRNGSTGGTLRATLVVVQAALSVMLLAGSILFVRSLDAVRTARMGYDWDRVVSVNRVLRGPALDPAARRALRDKLLETAAALPGVEAAAWRSSIPLGLDATLRISVPGIESLRELGDFTGQETTPDYFRVMGTRVIRGRGFTSEDRAGAPRVAVVSQGMANVLWPSADPLGKCLIFGPPTSPCTTVVGVVEDIVQRSLTTEQRYQYYLAIDQAPGADGTGLMIRTRTDPAAAADGIRRALQQVMPPGSYVTVQPMRDLVQRSHRSWQLGATMFVAFGGLALLLSVVGLYGVIAHAVGQRMHELSVRIALGARPGHILGIVVGPSVRFALAGVAGGTLLAVWTSRWVQPLLYRQSATDPRVYAEVAVVMLLVALVASAIPAVRASRASPNAALRAE